MTLAPCFICGSHQHVTILHSREVTANGDLLRCGGCGLVSVHPLPSESTIAAYYRGLYSDRAAGLDALQWQRARESLRGYISELTAIGHFHEGMKFLDLGGGLGYYAAAAEEAGFEATLVDVDPVSIAFAREHHRITTIVHASEFSAGEIPSGPYDVVFARHLIEHVKDPSSLLRSAWRCLRDNGILILETDNNDGIEMLLKPGTCRWYLDLYRRRYRDVTWWRLLRAKPFAADPPRHLYAFSAFNLQALSHNCGFDVRRVLTYRLGDRVYWPNLPDSDVRSVLGSIARLRLRNAATHFLDIILTPIRRLLPVFGRAAGLCIYARKSATREGPNP